MNQLLSSSVSERTLVLTRVFNAPRSLVFKAWTDPRQLGQWWGPTGFTNPVCELDLKPFGEIRIDMRAPDGTVYPMSGAFREIVPPERLEFTAAALDANGKPIFENLNTVTFEEFEGNKTLLKLHVRVLWESLGAERYLAGMSEGWSRSFDRLNAFVEAEAQTAGRELRASRLLHAPRDLVYRMWTEPEHIAQWWGPKGFTNTIYEMDVRPGGVWRFVMHGPDGRDYPNENHYVEVAPPERLVFDHVVWPKFRMTATFLEAAGKTEVSIQMIFDSAADLDKVVREFGAAEGLEENLERLGAHLATL